MSLIDLFVILAVALCLHHIQRAFGDRVYHVVSAAVLAFAVVLLVTA